MSRTNRSLSRRSLVLGIAGGMRSLTPIGRIGSAARAGAALGRRSR